MDAVGGFYGGVGPQGRDEDPSLRRDRTQIYLGTGFAYLTYGYWQSNFGAVTGPVRATTDTIDMVTHPVTAARGAYQIFKNPSLIAASYRNAANSGNFVTLPQKVSGDLFGLYIGSRFGVTAEGTLAARQATARSFYESAGWSDARISSHLAGIDFSRPVDVISLSGGEALVQHMAPGSRVGNYFAPAGTSASMLGINPAGRVSVSFSPNTRVPVLRSTAAPIVDTWTVPQAPFNASGGGVQYFTQNPNHFRRIP
jgi:hypothetical protein